MKPWYNGRLRMTWVIRLLGLRGLEAAEQARYQAGYDRKERLSEYVFLGRWVGDTCGNMGKIKEDRCHTKGSFLN